MIKMKCYKVKVREYSYQERYVYVNADSKTEANRLAKNEDWVDAEAGEYNRDFGKSAKIVERAVLHSEEEL